MSNNKPAWTEVLKQWEPTAPAADAPPSLFPVTNNVTRETFECVKKNPGITAQQAVAMLPKQKPTSVTSLLAQMVKNGLCRKQGLGFHALVDEYLPLKRAYAKYATVQKPKAKAKPPAPALEQQLAPAKEQQPATASSLMMSLNVVEARLLYDELKKVFN